MPFADLVFAGGPVFLADAIASRATAVAVADGRIIAVGHDEVRAFIGPDTEVVDLAGRLLIPGFQDAHVHPVWGGLQMLRCGLDGVEGKEGYLSLIAAYAAAHPDAAWILGGGWSMADFPGGMPRKEDLDAIVPDRPVYLRNRDGHSAWVNTAALTLAGVTAETPDPQGGRIERDPDGTPTGSLHEAAMELVGGLTPPATADEAYRAILLAQEYPHSLGITAWQDAIVGEHAGMPDSGETYMQVSADGKLTARVVGALWWDAERGLEQIPELVAKRERWQADGFAATSIKLMQDGVPETFTAAMIDPYLDPATGKATDARGDSFIQPAVLNAACIELDKLGFQLHFHAIGDRAVRECLDAVELTIAANGRNDNRHHMVHLQVIHPDDLPRFRELGVTANLQSLWATLEPQMVDLCLPALGEERGRWQYPWADLRRLGTVFASGSDWSVSTPDPWAAMHVAVNRVVPPGGGESTEPFLPEQAIDLVTALTAYTAGSAYVNHLDDTGHIAVGALADLVVLDRDPFAAPTDEIGLTRTLATYVGGRLVWSAAN